MHKDGVLVEVTDLPINQYKNVQIQLRRSNEAGTFEMRVVLLSVELEKWRFYLRDLIDEQKQGRSVTEVVNRLKFSTTQLIDLIEKEFPVNK